MGPLGIASVSRPAGSLFFWCNDSSSTMQQYHYAHAKLSEITDQGLNALIDEVSLLRHTPRKGQMIHFLIQSLYSSGKWSPFKKWEFRSPEYLTGKGYLTRKIGTFVSSDVYQLCLDLLKMPNRIQGESIEDHHGDTLYVFLNKVLRDQAKKKKRQPLL